MFRLNSMREIMEDVKDSYVFVRESCLWISGRLAAEIHSQSLYNSMARWRVPW